MQPPGGAVREGRQVGLRTGTPGLVRDSVVPCPVPVGKALTASLRLCGPGGHRGVCRTDGSIEGQEERSRSPVQSLPSCVLCLQFLGYPPTKPDYMSHVTCDCNWNHDSHSPLSCPYFIIIIPHAHYLLWFNNLWSVPCAVTHRPGDWGVSQDVGRMLSAKTKEVPAQPGW